MPHKLIIQAIAAAVVLTFAAGILLTGDDVNPSWLRFFSVSVLIAMAALWCWDQWIWRTPLAQNIPGVPRDVRGTWEGRLDSFWINPATNERPPAKAAYLVVRQTAFSVRVTLITNESISHSSLAVLSDHESEVKLDYMYLAKPQSRVEHRSRIHHGSASFAVIGRPVKRLQGRYWTDRDSKGELTFAVRASNFAEDYEGAQSLFPVARSAPASA